MMDKTISQNRAEKLGEALDLLRWARDLLKDAGAERALERTRAAISSTEGALRHASNKDMNDRIAAAEAAVAEARA